MRKDLFKRQAAVGVVEPPGRGRRHRRGLQGTLASYRETVKVAADTEEDIADATSDEVMTRRALNLLFSKRNDSYEAALAALREDTQQWWADVLARDPDELEEDKTPATADAEGASCSTASASRGSIHSAASSSRSRCGFCCRSRPFFRSSGGKIWYDDQREVHRQIFEGDETIEYAFMGQDPDAADNRWLREACENQIPIIYFLGIAPGRYQAMLPTFISAWDDRALKARVAFGPPDQEPLAPPATALERRYALRAVKQRLHQASFREAVITAYNGRCALSGLPESLLLDAAHIVADKDEQFGQPVVPKVSRSRRFIMRRSTRI